MQLSVLFANLGQGAVYAVIVFFFMVAAKKIADKRTTTIDDDHEIQEKSNKAIGFRRSGLTIAYAIAFYGALSGASAGFAGDLIALVVDGILITVCLFACRSLNDRVMLAHVDNDEEAARCGNVAVGAGRVRHVHCHRFCSQRLFFRDLGQRAGRGGQRPCLFSGRTECPAHLRLLLRVDDLF